MLQSPDLMLFLAIVREGNMVAAGKRLGIDQSTVARRLTALERDLGARLFDRSSRGVSPTPAAFALQAHAERIESELLAASASVAARDDVVEGVSASQRRKCSAPISWHRMSRRCIAAIRA